jgi:Cdc6-like AAA superfamily ATPase
LIVGSFCEILSDNVWRKVSESLANLIESQTTLLSKKFQQRDFVENLISFCLNKDYRAILGIVYGLRSTGKTVGMLQAAEQLISQGHKVAYARFNYKTTDMSDVNSEILQLAKEGYTHFFVDKAPYLSGFLHGAAEWADIYVPCNRIKIVVYSVTLRFSIKQRKKLVEYW